MSDILLIFKDNWLLLLVGQYPHGPLGGLAITFLLSIFGLLLAFPLSVAIALARVSPFRWLRVPATVLVYAVRGIPLVMLIFWVYFFVPLLIGQTVNGFTTMLVTLVIYQAAYLAEIIRAGIAGLPKGQTEAARAVGLSYMQTTVKVILPQALYNMMPAMISQFVSTIKETSLGYVISVNELTFAANQINSTLLTKPFEVFLILTVIYFLLCFSLTQLARYVERRINKKRAGEKNTIITELSTSASS
ncbi:amino acid ABC transporter permease [Brenneria goodwinii]|uniref:Glutamate/aspartate import permease protein GltK n=1 Tax=Brenneria goodwinii TaxID=1109412 RepID=A0A0G4JQL4_9GAMM|nr:amino acid ABC transporter permease [Brenneria goodwinii]ATA25189.1 amino acid ABC transporter permease [Brenneria goodwinii]MCG8157960.1 amino acid ABC transporter permease [Brenneria goodwinii]MCG8162552.1 amino acid ABC transporter permease [Brenneria goodwinii]MCG8166593.1 amino acid ABC transporter permease [Brenneria goodwinii]MCG8172514.1 amino acid ABC transporter permease [Brenneria goodwinii]